MRTQKTPVYLAVLFSLAAFFPVSCSKSDSHMQSPFETETQELYSHTITLQEAEAKLLEIMGQLAVTNTKSSSKKIVSRYSTGAPIPTKAEGEIAPYVHIFNFENAGGFALMSGDDRIPSLLALTTQGELTPETEVDNPGVMMWLANMETAFLNGLDPQPGQPNKPVFGWVNPATKSTTDTLGTVGYYQIELTSVTGIRQ